MSNSSHKKELLPVLFDFLEKCRPIDFASRVETILPVITNDKEKEVIDSIIDMKSNELSDSQIKKLRSVLRKYEKQKS